MEWSGSGLRRTSSDEAISALTVCADAYDRISPAKFEEQPTVWTNEKHNLYIESLEISFVQQLHQSLGFSCRNITHQLHTNNHDKVSFYYQFAAGQSGCRKTASRPEQLAVSYDSRHLSSSYGEVSDQKFIDEGEVTSLTSNARRGKKSSNSASQDQVVP
uniref:Uncharacterized protein n=1 Tax=Kalanchoe fedtschenkoi TaxID=63787 RepID=A0A7N0T1W4_KALFE